MINYFLKCCQKYRMRGLLLNNSRKKLKLNLVDLAKPLRNGLKYLGTSSTDLHRPLN